VTKASFTRVKPKKTMMNLKPPLFIALVFMLSCVFFTTPANSARITPTDLATDLSTYGQEVYTLDGTFVGLSDQLPHANITSRVFSDGTVNTFLYEITPTNLGELSQVDLVQAFEGFTGVAGYSFSQVVAATGHLDDPSIITSPFCSGDPTPNCGFYLDTFAFTILFDDTNETLSWSNAVSIPDWEWAQNVTVTFFAQSPVDWGLGDISLTNAVDLNTASTALPGGTVPTPEPATLFLLGSGLAALGLYRQRKSNYSVN